MRLLCCVAAAVMFAGVGSARADVVRTFVCASAAPCEGIVGRYKPESSRMILLASGTIEPTPEPTSVAMLGTSLLGLAILMRLRFRP